jgi:hypothetical protein
VAKSVAVIIVTGDVTPEALIQELTTLAEIFELDYGWTTEIEIDGLS